MNHCLPCCNALIAISLAPWVFYDLRAALDDEVGRKLAITLRDDENAALETLLRTMDKEAKAGDIHRYYPNNLRFHDLLANAGAPVLWIKGPVEVRQQKKRAHLRLVSL
jgi:hypothetical protein